MEEEKAPYDTEQIKNKLKEQFLFLAERSKEAYGKELVDLTNAMISLAGVLAPELHNQSFYAASTCHPYVVQLPIEDLLELYVARAKERNAAYLARRI